MDEIGKLERATQHRVLQLFQKELGYEYLGDWKDRQRSIPVEEDLLRNHLVNIKGYTEVLAQKAVEKL